MRVQDCLYENDADIFLFIFRAQFAPKRLSPETSPSQTKLAYSQPAKRRTPRSVCDARTNDTLNIGTPSHSRLTTMMDETSSG